MAKCYCLNRFVGESCEIDIFCKILKYIRLNLVFCYLNYCLSIWNHFNLCHRCVMHFVINMRNL